MGLPSSTSALLLPARQSCLESDQNTFLLKKHSDGFSLHLKQDPTASYDLCIPSRPDYSPYPLLLFAVCGLRWPTLFQFILASGSWLCQDGSFLRPQLKSCLTWAWSPKQRTVVSPFTHHSHMPLWMSSTAKPLFQTILLIYCSVGPTRV